MQCIYYRSVMQSMYSYHLIETDSRKIYQGYVINFRLLFSSVQGKKNYAAVFNLLLIMFRLSKGSK
uniref:Uncharacterized protein n=1 Tax=Setaria viridis TaxID=4556 RepID=A0A4U6SVN1_SETVI|nr:hypothetical protein SEVIR_9G166050v2 [Setaria viridis]